MIKPGIMKELERQAQEKQQEQGKVVVANKVKRIRQILNKNGEVIRTIEL